MPESQSKAVMGAVVAAGKPIDAAHRRDILVFAALGIISGILSFVSARYIDFYHFSFFPTAAYRASAPILPGIIFGLLVAGCARHFAGKDRLSLLLAVLLTAAAWILAFDLASQADFSFGPQVTSEARGAIACGIGGLVGGLGTCIAVALANPRFRRLKPWLLTVLIATFFGAIERVYELFSGLFDDAALFALFVAWQTAVIASIARGLGRAQKS
jgi:hypothetical protein